MKQTYIKPKTTVIGMEPVSMIATSNPTPNIGIVKPGEEGGSGSEILSNDRRGSWGDLWK